MSNHRTQSHNHRQTDVSNTNYPAGNAQSGDINSTHASEIFPLISNERSLVTIAPYGWRTVIRRESPTTYTVRYENAAGVRSGKLHVKRREARQLVAEKCQEAVWVNLQDRTEGPSDAAAVDGGETQ